MENRRISWNSPGKSRIIDIIKYISCRVSYIPLFFLILILNSYSLEVKVVDNVNVKNIHDDIISSVSLGGKSISEDLEFSGLEGITVIIERRPEKTDRVAYALPEKNTIVIYYPFEFNTFPYSNLNTVIYHEISHIILYHKAGPRTRLPLWFHEGIAMYESKELYPFIAFKVTGILYSGTELRLENLEDGFPGERTEEAYIKSYLAVSYIADKYGTKGIIDLIAGFSTSRSVDFKTVCYDAFDVTYEGFENGLHDYISERYNILQIFLRGQTVIVILAFFSIIVFIYLKIKQRRDAGELSELQGDDGKN